jgi:hypothetical protein
MVVYDLHRTCHFLNFELEVFILNFPLKILLKLFSLLLRRIHYGHIFTMNVRQNSFHLGHILWSNVIRLERLVRYWQVFVRVTHFWSESQLYVFSSIFKNLGIRILRWQIRRLRFHSLHTVFVFYLALDRDIWMIFWARGHFHDHGVVFRDHSILSR